MADPQAKTSEVHDWYECDYRHDGLSVLVVGASGDLAAKKTHPALLSLFRDGYLPKHSVICGFARSAKTDDEFRQHLAKKLSPGGVKDPVIDEFLARCYYRAGNYGDVERVAEVYEDVACLEKEALARESISSSAVNRLFYFAIPPSVFAKMAKSLKASAESTSGWNRYIIEKPFGQDLDSFELLNADIKNILNEDQIFRIDHYLGKQLVQNLLLMRFGNSIFEPLWNRDHISSVTFSFKENFGTAGRGGFYDDVGVLRDVMQNHLLQTLSLFAMEAPVRSSGDAIRDEKRKVLESVSPIRPEDCIIAQYTADDAGKIPSYTDDETVPNDSQTPTYAAMVMYVNNPRWDGVPFILRAGKALNERKSEIRVQFKRPPGSAMLFPKEGSKNEETVARNELVIRLQPNEAMYVKFNIKKPGLRTDPVVSELDLSYQTRYHEEFVRLPDAYTLLVLQVLRGDQSSFVREDELRVAWRIFTPLLKAIDNGEIPLQKYKALSRGPAGYDELAHSVGFVHDEGYQWVAPAKM